MAVRRETVRKQFEDAVQPLLAPGEHIVAGASGASGPNPLWLSGLFGLVGMLVAGVRYYFVWVTDRRVIFMGASMMTARPKGNVAWSDPRSSVAISDVTPAATWSWFKYHRPGAAKPIRMNFPRPWPRGLRADDPSVERHDTVGTVGAIGTATSRAATADLSRNALVRWRFAPGV